MGPGPAESRGRALSPGKVGLVGAQDPATDSTVAVGLPSPRPSEPKTFGIRTGVFTSGVLWVLRALWVSLPVTAGPLLGDALNDVDSPLRTVASLGLWGWWALVIPALFVPTPITLTLVRIVVPASLAATMWATIVDGASAWAALALGVTAAATVVALTAAIGGRFADGASYGDERRLLLRPPSILLAGPIPLTWLATVAGVCVGPLLANQLHWIVCTLITVVGVGIAAACARALHQLGRRWLVFVPTGFVLHDLSALTDPVLFRRADVVRVGPALADTDATDLTGGAAGLVLEAQLAGPTDVPVRGRGREADTVVAIERFLVCPSQPGAVLDVAARRRLSVG